MNEQQTGSRDDEALILRDGRGDYYAIPRLLVEQLRVPEERHAELEALFAADTAGFAAEWTVRSGLGLEITTTVQGISTTATILLGGPANRYGTKEDTP